MPYITKLLIVFFTSTISLASFSQRAKLYIGLPTKSYYKNGNLRIKRNFQDTKLLGYKTFYKSGQLRSNYVFNEKGQHDSIANFYYPNGNIKTIWEYKKGIVKKRTDFTLDGKVIKGKKDYEKLKACNDALYGDRRNFGAILRRASLNCKLGFYDESQEDYIFFFKNISPKRLKDWALKSVYHNMAINYAAFENYSKSLEYNFKALHVKPNNQATVNNMGEVFYKAGDLKHALEYSNKCHEINPKNYHSFFNKAKIFLETGDIEKSYDYIQKTIADERSHKLSTKDVSEERTIWATRGEINYKLGKHNEAIKDLEKALEENPVNSYAYMYLALTYKDLNEKDKFCDAINNAIKHKYDKVYNTTEASELLNQNCNK